jgi:hypothetical protein
MDDAEDSLAVKVQALSDLELAVVICIVAGQHCIIESEHELLNDVGKELELVGGLLCSDKKHIDEKQVAGDVFGLTCAVLDCSEHTTLDDFGTGILVGEDGNDYFNNKPVKTGGDVCDYFP